MIEGGAVGSFNNVVSIEPDVSLAGPSVVEKMHPKGGYRVVVDAQKVADFLSSLGAQPDVINNLQIVLNYREIFDVDDHESSLVDLTAGTFRYRENILTLKVSEATSFRALNAIKDFRGVTEMDPNQVKSSTIRLQMKIVEMFKNQLEWEMQQLEPQIGEKAKLEGKIDAEKRDIYSSLTKDFRSKRLVSYLMDPNIEFQRKMDFLTKLALRVTERDLDEVLRHELAHFLQTYGPGNTPEKFQRTRIKYIIKSLLMPYLLGSTGLTLATSQITDERAIALITLAAIPASLYFFYQHGYYKSPWEIDARRFASEEQPSFLTNRLLRVIPNDDESGDHGQKDLPTSE